MFAVRSSQFAVRSSQFAVRRTNYNLLNYSFILLAFIFAALVFFGTFSTSAWAAFYVGFSYPEIENYTPANAGENTFVAAYVDANAPDIVLRFKANAWGANGSVTYNWTYWWRNDNFDQQYELPTGVTREADEDNGATLVLRISRRQEIHKDLTFKVEASDGISSYSAQSDQFHIDIYTPPVITLDSVTQNDKAIVLGKEMKVVDGVELKLEGISIKSGDVELTGVKRQSFGVTSMEFVSPKEVKGLKIEDLSINFMNGENYGFVTGTLSDFPTDVVKVKTIFSYNQAGTFIGDRSLATTVKDVELKVVGIKPYEATVPVYLNKPQGARLSFDVLPTTGTVAITTVPDTNTATAELSKTNITDGKFALIVKPVAVGTTDVVLTFTPGAGTNFSGTLTSKINLKVTESDGNGGNTGGDNGNGNNGGNTGGDNGNGGNGGNTGGDNGNGGNGGNDGGNTGGDSGNDGNGGNQPHEITIDGVKVPYAAVGAPDEEVAKAVKDNVASLLPGLPYGVPFFFGTENMTFPSVNELLSFIEEIYEKVTGEHVEFKAVMPPVKVSAPGVYLMKVTLTDEQREELKGSRDLKYNVVACENGKAEAQIAEDAENSDGSNGVLVGRNGEELTGEYDGGNLNALVYFARADTTYVQYLTTETDETQEVSPDVKGGSSPNSGCEVGFGFMAFAFVLPWAAAVSGKR